MMENNILKQLQLMISKIINNETVDDRQLQLILKTRTQMPLRSIENLQENLIIHLMEVTDKVNKKMIEQIQNFLTEQKTQYQKQQFQTGLALTRMTMKKETNVSEFFHFYQKKNELKTGVSLVDQQGKFIFYDDYTREIIEQSKETIEKYSLFQFMFRPSLDKLFERPDCGNVLLQNNVGNYQFSVFSERNRKKAFKYVTKIKKTLQEEKHKNKAQREAKKSLREEEYNIQDEITCKYLKCLEMELKRVELVVTRQCLLSISDSSLNFNPKHQDLMELLSQNKNQVQIQALICELKEAEDFQRFSQDELTSDVKIEKYERKFRDKMKKIKKQIQNDI